SYWPRRTAGRRSSCSSSGGRGSSPPSESTMQEREHLGVTLELELLDACLGRARSLFLLDLPDFVVRDTMALGLPDGFHHLGDQRVGVSGRAPGSGAEPGEYTLDASLGVESRTAHHAVACPARPAHHEDAGHWPLALVIPNLVRPAGILPGVGRRDVEAIPVGQAESLVDLVAHGEDHRVAGDA